jgi:hypothetical protein
MTKAPRFDGPIPGENYTSDTKNYPWHRPPDVTNLKDFVEESMKRASEPEKSSGILAALEAGMPLADLMSYSLLSAVGRGRVSIDTAILSAGPLTRYIEEMAKAEGVEYQRGWEQEPKLATPTDIEMAARAVPEEPETVEEEETEEPASQPQQGGGLMAMSSDAPAPKDMQMQMLGYADEESTE